MEFSHKPVLLSECLEGLQIRKDGVYVDCTLGGGGHSYEIAKQLGPEGMLIGIDQDDDALAAANARLAEFSCFRSVKANFSELSGVLRSFKLSGADGILFDLGVSSYQLDNGARGFSYHTDAPLDMRMDTSKGQTAAELIADISHGALARILRDYGEERFASQIASAIVSAREKAPIETTFALRDIIVSAIPAGFAKREKQHPAKRSFQAIRIAVNNELFVAEEGIKAAIDSLNPGGRLCVISFHSLEDRITKVTMAKAAAGCNCPRDFPVCVCGASPSLKLITKKPITASEAELNENPRARSAKLRIAEKI
jgi:16S rRNA (cytosine1402-N4)-methyltransferase